MGFPVVVYGCESWTVKKAEHQELMLLNCGVGEDSWESLGLQGDQSVHPKGDHSWVFVGRTDAKAETPIFLPPHAKSWLLGKDPDARKNWREAEKGTTEDEMVGWHHWLDVLDREALGVRGRQGRLVCRSASGHRVRHNWVIELNWIARIAWDFKFSSMGVLFS